MQTTCHTCHSQPFRLKDRELRDDRWYDYASGPVTGVSQKKMPPTPLRGN